MDRHSNNSQLRNIKLISDKNQSYQNYLLQFKTKKEKDVVYDKPAPAKAFIMSYLLELAVVEWVKNSGIYKSEKIISYQYGNKNRPITKYKELDYVLQDGTSHFVGEVKVSASANGLISEAIKQLIFSKELLSKISKPITMQIIRIDMNFRNAVETFDVFNEKFELSNFRDFERDGTIFKLLYLSAEDVFNYGVSKKIIKSPEIFLPAVYENELLYEQRKTKEQIKKNKKELANIEELEQIKLINSANNELEQKVFLNDIKIKLSQVGWVQLDNISEDDYKFIIDYLGVNIDEEITLDDFCERTKGFCTDDHKTKFISYYCRKEEIEFNFFDAEMVYLRLLDEQKSELQNIKFVAKFGSESYPLLNKTPYRKFYYSNNLLNKEDSHNKALQQFEHVINRSQPTVIKIKPNDVLIFDNHRMLHRKSNFDKLNVVKKVILVKD